MERFTLEHRGKQHEVRLNPEQIKLARAGFLLIRVGRKVIRATMEVFEMPEGAIEIDLDLDESASDGIQPQEDWFRSV